MTISSLWFMPLGAAAAEIKCEGAFAPDTTHSRLVDVFGLRNVSRETVFGVEDLEFPGSVLFGNDVARRIEIIWEDEKAQKPASLHFKGNAWSAPAELRIGGSMDKVEAANGKPFILYGFEWDYGGLVENWKDGALARLPGGCRLTITFQPDQTSSEDALIKAAGNSTFSSGAPEIRAVKPRIKEIGFVYSR